MSSRLSRWSRSPFPASLLLAWLPSPFSSDPADISSSSWHPGLHLLTLLSPKQSLLPIQQVFRRSFSCAHSCDASPSFFLQRFCRQPFLSPTLSPPLTRVLSPEQSPIQLAP